MSPSRAGATTVAGSIAGGPVGMVGGPSAVQCMNHGYLNHRSEVFGDDKFDTVEKRCFVLLCGKQMADCGISIDLAVNLFDDPRTKKNVQVSVLLDQFIIEYNSDVLKSITNLAVDYKIATMFSDLHPAPGPSKINKKKNLMRMIELQAPIFALKKMLLPSSMPGNYDASIKQYHAEWLKQLEENKPHQQKQREIKEKHTKMIQKLRKVDKLLTEFNFDVAISLKRIYLGVTGEKDDALTGH